MELLAAMAVSSVLLLLLSTLFSSASGTSHGQSRLIDNHVRARAVLDAMARDVGEGVYRPDLAAFKDAAGSDAFCLYTARPAVGASVRNTSLVLYRTDAASAVLQRGALPILWDDEAARFSFGVTDKLPRAADVVPEDVAAGVVRMGLYFVGTDGTLSRTYTPGKSAAVEITLAVIDEETQKTLSSSQLANLTGTGGALPDDPADPPTKTLLSFWSARMAAAGFYDGYPQTTRTGLLLFERCAPLPH